MVLLSAIPAPALQGVEDPQQQQQQQVTLSLTCNNSLQALRLWQALQPAAQPASAQLGNGPSSTGKAVC